MKSQHVLTGGHWYEAYAQELSQMINPTNRCCISECAFIVVLCCRRQDEDLDEIGSAAQRLGHMGLQIHDELQTQNAMLEQLDEDVEQTTSRLAAAQKKINTVLQKAGLRGQLMIIGILLVLLVVLVMIAFS